MKADEEDEGEAAAEHQEDEGASSHKSWEGSSGMIMEVKGNDEEDEGWRKKRRRRQWKKTEEKMGVEPWVEEFVDRKVMIGEVSKQKGEMVFQVCDVMSALAAVARIVEKGNRVVFDEESCIQNKTTGKKTPMRKKGRAFVIDVVMEDGEKEEIAIDSAAEESVCPEKWAEGFGIERVEESKRLKLVGANASDIHNYGKRKVLFDTTFF